MNYELIDAARKMGQASFSQSSGSMISPPRNTAVVGSMQVVISKLPPDCSSGQSFSQSVSTCTSPLRTAAQQQHGAQRGKKQLFHGTLLSADGAEGRNTKILCLVKRQRKSLCGTTLVSRRTVGGTLEAR